MQILPSRDISKNYLKSLPFVKKSKYIKIIDDNSQSVVIPNSIFRELLELLKKDVVSLQIIPNASFEILYPREKGISDFLAVKYNNGQARIKSCSAYEGMIATYILQTPSKLFKETI